MKRLITGILLFVLGLEMKAQLFPLSDMYSDNKTIINPSFTGSDEALQVTLQHRNQWTGFPDAPKNTAFIMQAPFHNTGLGLMILRNSFGIYKETSVAGSYAYHRPLKSGTLAMGIGFGMTSYKMDWGELRATDPNDDVLTEAPQSALLPDFSIGFSYYNKKYFIGFSLPFFMSHVSDGQTGKLRMKNIFSQYNYFITGGYDFKLNRNTYLLPTAIIRYQPDGGLQTDLQVMLTQWNRIGIGAGYRTTKMWIGQVECHVNDQLRVIYSYDSGFGKTGTYKGGSHEMMLTYVFRYTRNVIGPRNF
jgi:type IX secretion system PorP/SprF family membrane protein